MKKFKSNTSILASEVKNGKEKSMVTVLKTAIICATIVTVVYLLMKSGDDKKDKDQKGEE